MMAGNSRPLGAPRDSDHDGASRPQCRPRNSHDPADMHRELERVAVSLTQIADCVERMAARQLGDFGT